MSWTELTLGGETVRLLLVRPTWKRGPRLKLRCPDRLTEADAGRETRRPAAARPELTLTEDYAVQDGAAAAVEAWLATIGSDRVAVPLYWDELAAGDYGERLLDAAWWWDYAAEDVIAAGAVPLLDPATRVAPLLIGLLEERPETRTHQTKGGKLSLTINQDGPMSWAVLPRDWAGATTTWPTDLTPTRANLVQLSDDHLEARMAGQGGERARRDGGAPMRWGQDATFILTGRDAIRDLVSFWAAVWARVGVYDLPAWYTPHDVATPETPDGYKARLADDELELQFLARGDAAKTGLRWWQLPWELNPPDSEAPVQRPVAYLFEFRYEVPTGGPVTYRYTDWGTQLTLGADAYTAALIEPGDIVESTEWGKSQMEVETFWVDGNPLQREWLGRSNAPLWLTVWECDPDDVDNTAEVVAKGLIREPERTEHGFRAIAGEIEEYDVPRRPIARYDYRAAYSEESFLNEDDQRRTGQVVAIWTDGKVLLDWTDAGGNPASHYFQGGLMEAGSGETYEVRECIESWKDTDGTDQTALPDDPFDFLSVGDTIHLYPAYDGSWEQLKSRFPTLKNDFRGFPYGPRRQPGANGTTLGISGKGGGK